MTTLAEAIASTSAHALFDRTTVRVVRVPALDSTAYARALDSLAEGGCDGIALMAPETPQVRDAIRRATEAGVAVVALVSDQPHSARHHFVGIDNVRAGRTAAMLLGRFAARPRGRVLVLAGSMMLRDHMERRLGFDAIMREQFPGMTVLPSVEARDDSQAVRRLLPLALAEHGPIDAIYSIGAGNRGLVEALDDLGLGAALTVVAHDLTPTMRRGLESGVIDAVITQDVGHMVRSALRVLRARSERLPIDPGQEQIRIEILIRENLPQDRSAATT